MIRSEAVTFAELEEHNRETDNPHVCGFCRNPWSKFGRPDCPNARRDR